MNTRTVLIATVAAASIAGCAARHAVTRQDLTHHLEQRLGSGIPDALLDDTAIPPGVDLEDGMSADEAVALALWNNPTFAVTVTDLGFARADLLSAGKLANPMVTGLVPLDPRQWQVAASIPVEGLWIRPARVATARAQDEAVGQRVVQAAVDLARDVRVAYIDAATARARVGLLSEVARLQSERKRLLGLRVEVGDASPITLDAAYQDELDAVAGAQRAQLDESRSATGLAWWTGVSGANDMTTDTLTSWASEITIPERDTSLARARVSRPDLRAAELDLLGSAR